MYLNRPEPKRRWVIHNRTKDLLSDGPSLQTITEIKDINAKISYDPKTSVHTAPNLYMQPSFDFYIPPKERKEPNDPPIKPFFVCAGVSHHMPKLQLKCSWVMISRDSCILASDL